MPGSGPYLKNKEHLFEWHAQICDVITSSATNWGMNQREQGQKGEAHLETGAITKEEMMMACVRTVPV